MPRRYLTSFNEDENNQCENNETFSKSERRCKLKYEEPKPFEPINVPKKKLNIKPFQPDNLTKFPKSDEEQFLLSDQANNLTLPKRRLRNVIPPDIPAIPNIPVGQATKQRVGQRSPYIREVLPQDVIYPVSRSVAVPLNVHLNLSYDERTKARNRYARLLQDDGDGIELETIPNHTTNPTDTFQSQNVRFSDAETTESINNIDAILTRPIPTDPDIAIPIIPPPRTPVPPPTPDMPRSLLDTDTPESSRFRQLEEAVRGRIPNIMEEPVATRPMNIQELSIGNATLDIIPNIDPTQRLIPTPRDEDLEAELTRTRDRLKRRGLTSEQIEDQIAEDRMLTLQEQSFRDRETMAEGRTSVRSIRDMFEQMSPSPELATSRIPRMRGQTNSILTEENALRASRRVPDQQDRERIENEIKQAHQQRLNIEQSENEVMDKITEFVSRSDNAELTQDNIDDIFEEFDGKIPREIIAKLIKEYQSTSSVSGQRSSRTQELLTRLRNTRTSELERFAPSQENSFTDVALDDEPTMSGPRSRFGSSSVYRRLAGDDNFTPLAPEEPTLPLPEIEPPPPDFSVISSRGRIFSQGQGYAPIETTQPFQEIELNEELQPLNVTRVGGTQTFTETLRRGLPTIRRPRVDDVLASGSGVAGGLIAGFGISELMQSAGVKNPYEIAGASGAGAGAFARVASMGSDSIIQRVTSSGANVATTVEDSAFTVAGRTSLGILKGGLIGGGASLALQPLGDYISRTELAGGATHMEAGAVSSAVTGATGEALTGIVLASIGAAPETLGMSLLVGAVSAGVSTALGAGMGNYEDGREASAQAVAKLTASQRSANVANARASLLRSLPDYNYNFQQALMSYKQIHYGDMEGADLGEDQSDWSSFTSRANYIFNPKPSNKNYTEPATDPSIPQPEAYVLHDYQQYINNQIMVRTCAGNTGAGCSAQRKNKNYQPLNDIQKRVLDGKTDGSWQEQADLVVQQTIMEATYRQQRMADAQKQLNNAWDSDTKTYDQIQGGNYLMQTASLDPDFRQRYDNRLMISAQQQIMNAYISSDGVTTLNKIGGQKGANLRRIANQDAGFPSAIQAYYTSINTTAQRMNLSTAQFLELNTLQRTDPSTPGYIAPAQRFKQMQFQNAQSDENIVTKATALAGQEDQVRQLGYYDIDQAMLETDPTAPNSWNPSDSQILQAHMTGMTLQQYVDYMHELSRGKEGDFSNLPKYNYEMLRGAGIDDFKHFQDELQLAGYDKNLYDYNEKTRVFTLNKNKQGVLRIPSINNSFVSAYTPQSLLDAQSDYSNYITGINRHDQAEVDAFNTDLHRRANIYGQHYDQQVANYNTQLIYEGRTDLLYFNSELAYRANMEHFLPFSKKLEDSTKNYNKFLDKSEFKSTREIALENQQIQRKANERKLESEIKSATALGVNLDTYLREKTLITKVIKDEKREKQQVNYADATQRAITKANMEAKTTKPVVKKQQAELITNRIPTTNETTNQTPVPTAPTTSTAPAP